MIVNLVNVFLHLSCQRRSDFAAAGLLRRCTAFAGYGELLDKCEFKISQAFDARITSAFTESRSATTRDGNGRSAKKYLPTNESFRGIRIHKARR